MDYDFMNDTFREDELLRDGELENLDIYDDIDYDGHNDDLS